MKILYMIRKWLRGFLVNPFGLLPENEGPYGWSPKEFQKAKKYAKSVPHPKFP